MGNGTQQGSSFEGDFTKIDGLSDKRRFPRQGKIRLGKKGVAASGNERPIETSYFVCPDEVKKVHGEEPTELDVMLPNDSVGACFPQAYECYGSGKGLKCKGSGVNARSRDEVTGEWKEQACPCERLKDKKDENGKVVKRAECSRRAHLMVMLPKVSVGGVYQIDIGSYNSIVDINSGLAYIKELLGRVALVPLKLKRIERETHSEGGQKGRHFTLHIHYQGNLEELAKLKRDSTRVLDVASKNLLAAPEEVNPEHDENAVIVPLKDEETNTPRETKQAETVEPEKTSASKAEPKATSAETKFYLKIMPDIIDIIGQKEIEDILKSQNKAAVEHLDHFQIRSLVKVAIEKAKKLKKPNWTKWVYKPKKDEEDIPF